MIMQFVAYCLVQLDTNSALWASVMEVKITPSYFNHLGYLTPFFSLFGILL